MLSVGFHEPEWRLLALCSVLLLAACMVLVADDVYVSAAGAAIGSVHTWWLLRYWPASPDGPLRTPQQSARGLLVTIGWVMLILAGVLA
jgi:hypothetical protein